MSAASWLHPILGYRLTVEGMHYTTTASESQEWVPQSCTLPTAEQPVRVREFDDLFARSLHSVEQVDQTQLRLTIDASAEGTASELTERETGCCSFFTFTFGQADDGRVVIDVTVPAAHTDVLTTLASRAASIAGLTD